MNAEREEQEITSPPGGGDQDKSAPSDEKARTKKKRRRWPWVLGVIFLVFFLLSFAFYEYSNTTQFCNSCHIMKPYYHAWETSKHNFVPCVDCHISPEDGAKWDAKIQGMLQVFKYVTRTYSSKPYAEIEDSSCLRSGCHEQRLVEEHSTEEFKNHVVFDHGPHLLEPRRGKELRCTSCHAQMVVGTHMEVTTSTCYLCHFKKAAGQDLERLSGCRLCHKKLPDKTITHQVVDPDHPGAVSRSVQFNHLDFLGDRQDINCQVCHVDVIQGQGAARRDRCFDCHNVPEHLERFSDTEFIHKNHITEHNVTCERCHEAISHEVRTQTLALEQSCNRCHVYTHSPQRDFYIGSGGRGVDGPQPSIKYQKMVDCSACHPAPVYPTGTGPHLTSFTFSYSESGCENCHGEDADSYIEALEEYMSETQDELASVRRKGESARRAVDSMQESERKKELKDKLMDAEFNLVFIEKALGWAHNWEYSTLLLKYSERIFEEITNQER